MSQRLDTERAPRRTEQCSVLVAVAWAAFAVISAGCGSIASWTSPASGDLANCVLIENPMFVPALDREFLWNQTVDAVDNYFRIEREERVRLIGGILTEGRIDTFPTVGSTLLEPWRSDSTPGYEKLHATLQSIRRKATVRVIPSDGGYLLDVVVQKELEDLDKPEHATAGSLAQRHDGTLVRQEGPPGRFSVTLGWIPIGRDVSLEQRILTDLHARLDVQDSLIPLAEEAPLEIMESPSDTPPAGTSPGESMQSPPTAQPSLQPPSRITVPKLELRPPNIERLPPPVE